MLDKKPIVIGGSDDRETMSSCEAYSAVGDVWSNMPSLNRKRD